ncbi:orotate phosphoribosyltransferase [Candidatus Woesearchaeota archaeon]|nr:orotate phosphoribosyltransferase [Candidatus Woesearchaeota archaeon]
MTDDANAYATRLAKIALDNNVIKLSPDKPFKWASGFHMPIYNDNRMLLGDATHRALVAEAAQAMLKKSGVMFDAIAGTSTAGISPGTTLADRLGIPMMYVRDKSKDHGMRNRIEGIDSNATLAGRKILVYEDLISTGGSSLDTVQAVRALGGIVTDMVSIFNYGFPEAKQMFDDAKVNVHSLLTYDQLLEVAISEGKINQSSLETLGEWRLAPFAWGAKHGFPKGESIS